MWAFDLKKSEVDVEETEGGEQNQRDDDDQQCGRDIPQMTVGRKQDMRLLPALYLLISPHLISVIRRPAIGQKTNAQRPIVNLVRNSFG